MSKSIIRLAIALLVSALLGVGPTFSVGAYCFAPTDASHKVYDYGCGTWDWELIANGTGGPYDEGTSTVYGFCGGDYTNCSCHYVEPSSHEGRQMLDFDYDENLEAYQFWWNTVNWNSPSFSGCSSRSCQEEGVVESDSSYLDTYEGADYEWCDP